MTLTKGIVAIVAVCVVAAVAAVIANPDLLETRKTLFEAKTGDGTGIKVLEPKTEGGLPEVKTTE
ncbi:hypothetical protein CKO38_13530 [Rhodospirillum rubrum]|uniref:hypothetical protein n=1 Tax=Rhodospirillum rubrum TaxID=1085 RepID=UPI001903EE5E|nr:hypothetical protein [Rhodospirillum rubrum]MBK1665569.1 hypothetical protein [Rhodospirillum rubrum]MBK1677672.1 hypothetical protein [Rhodospirillum rubrum]